MARLDTYARSEGVGDWLGGFLRSYAQVLFSSSRLVGAIFLMATAVFPVTMAAGMLGVVVSMATARLLSLSEETGRQGLFGYNGLLVGLGIGAAFDPSATTAGLLMGAAMASVLLTAAARSLMTVFDLPALSIPFVMTILAVLVAAPMLGLDFSFAAFRLGQPAWGLPVEVSNFLVTLGAVFFAPAPLAGLIVLIGLLVYSRVATLLAVFGYLGAVAVGAVVGAAIPMPNQLFLTLNMLIIAIALGGVWFVPGVSSFVLVGGATVVAAVFSLANYALFATVGFPILLLPISVTIWVVLYAMRQRMRDSAPKSVDFIPGSPEDNLAYYRTHVARFGAHYLARFRAPFLGKWICTQGPDGEITHRGHWRHALDFEVSGNDGQTFEGEGDRREDYHCYGLPVLAPADATVVRVVDDVEDNPIGEVNLQQNWGNYVLLYHGPGVYSLLAHLMPTKTKVVEGQTVRQGDELGRCGNSGRSPVPHLHFQLQSSPVVGAPTVVTELHDVVVGDAGDGGEALVSTFVPAEGDEVRNIVPDAETRALFAFGEPGFELEHDDGRVETIELEVDLANRRVMTSKTGARLYYDHNSLAFTVFDVNGPRRSALHLLRLALGRVPFEASEQLTWSDHLPFKYALPRPLAWLFDFVSPFLPQAGLELDYRARRRGDEFIIEGASRRTSGGRPRLRTKAVFTRQLGLSSVEVALDDHVRRAHRVAPRDRAVDQTIESRDTQIAYGDIA